ncbi:hypothetical protein TorRG33x02_113390 [Trema orientale]|uniref:Non-specific lipid-transfer protein n=1 Tax=Trema orientale TaxID=63057 RepID=A0A2P5F4L6_TREOI|nr:hypothetical protein TorRG33x02_113390 [Trema orientale]
MASSSVVKLLCLVVLAIVVASPVADALTCGQVSSSIGPCVNYLKSGGRSLRRAATGLGACSRPLAASKESTSVSLLDFPASAVSTFLTRSVPQPTATVCSEPGP